MSENYSEVRNFWDDFNKAYYEWALSISQIETQVADNILKPDDIIEPDFFESQFKINGFCSRHFHAQNCTQCDDLCEIQNMDPCRIIWTGLSEQCCRTCDFFVASCEVDECLIQSTTSSNDDNTTQVLTASPLTGYTISLGNGTNENFRDPESFYVLVTLLPICGFIGRGCY